MRFLFVDAFHSIDQAALQFFRARGHDVEKTRLAGDALVLIGRYEFDCIFLDVSTIADSLGFREVRALARTSGIVLMGTSPVVSLVKDSLSMGHLEFQPIPTLIANIHNLVQPALLVASEFHASLTEAIKHHGLRTLSATTLQFAMNLMADGWCQIVCLAAKVPGLIQSDDVAIVHHIGPREVAILASVLPGAGVVFTQKPRTLGEFVALMQSVAENRPVPCGVVGNFASPPNRDR
jgi:hypothetical protein